MFSTLFVFLIFFLLVTALSFTCADISLFDELEDLGDADELLEALVESVGYVSQSRFITHLFFLKMEFPFSKIHLERENSYFKDCPAHFIIIITNFFLFDHSCKQTFVEKHK